MTFGFWVQGLYCFVAGLCLLLIKLNGDVCVAHDALLKTNLDQTITVRGVQSVPLGDAAVQVLVCDGKPGDGVADGNNFVSIFGMKAVFDMSSELQSASEQVAQQKTPLLTIKDGVANVTEAVLQVKAYPMNINGTYNGTTAAANITAALAGLPPAVFDRTDPDQITDFQTKYLGTADQRPLTAVTWQWTGAAADSYATLLQNLTDVLAAMSVEVPTWYSASRPAYSDISAALTASGGVRIDANTVASLMNYTEPSPSTQTGIKAYFCGTLFIDTDPEDNIVDGDADLLEVYTNDNSAVDLCTAATAVDSYTADIDKRVKLNADFIADATAIQGLLPGMTSNLANLTALMVSMESLLGRVDVTLTATNASVDASVANLVPLSASILGLNDVFQDAPEYSMCGFVGTFFKSVYKDTLCKDVQSDVRALAGPILAVALIIFLGFMLYGCFAPALRKRPEPSAALFADSSSNSAAAADKEDKRKKRRAAKKNRRAGAALDSGEVLLISSAPNTPSATPMGDEQLPSMFATGSLDEAEAAFTTGNGSPRNGSPTTSQHQLSTSSTGRRVIELPVLDSSGHNGSSSGGAVLDSPRSDNGDTSGNISPTSKPLLDAGSFQSRTNADV
jgi:archaellum component FlaF (FlaF/FlaG flagellin family)